MLYSLFVVVISTLLASYGIKAEESEGKPCSLSKDLFGECKSLENCPDAVGNVTKGELPVMCDSLGLDLMVCCPIARKTNTDRTSSSTVTTQRRADAEQINTKAWTQCRYPGRLAKQKCALYARTVYPLEEPSASTVTEPFELPYCVSNTWNSFLHIMGGEKAKEQEFPHMVAVGFNRPTSGILWGCGGTLVSANFVLTAAHCTSSLEFGNAVRVKVGIINLVRDTGFGRPQERQIIEIIRHPLYKSPSKYHDIALLRLERPVIFNDYVRPACLSTARHTDGPFVATGWGLTGFSEKEGSSDLLKVVLNIVDQPSCNSSFVGQSANRNLKYGIVDDWQICAGGDGQHDTCSGDSGGPLATKNLGHACMYNVVGITSFGRKCGYVSPGVYTRVYNYICWLEAIIWQS